jgi:hypothetical protein
MLRTTSLHGCALVFAATMALSAADPDERTALQKLVNSPEIQQGVLNAAQRAPVVEQNPCPSARFTIEPRLTLLQPLALDDQGLITSGAWHQTVRGEGCGSTRSLNVLVSVEPPHHATMKPMLPGSTHTDPLLQKDGYEQAARVLPFAAAAKEARGHCQEHAYVADTEFLQEDKDTILPGAKGHPWSESWTFVLCSWKFLVPLRFTPDATGTGITIPLPEIKLIP